MPEKVYPYDPADGLKTDEAIAFFLECAFEGSDAAHMANAIGIAARAKGMTNVAKATGLAREQLYKSLSPEGNPTLSTVVKVMQTLGLELTVRRPRGKQDEQTAAAE